MDCSEHLYFQDDNLEGCNLGFHQKLHNLILLLLVAKVADDVSFPQVNEGFRC